MPYIQHRGSPSSNLWVILEKPFDSDIKGGVLLSGGLGFAMRKMMYEAGLDMDRDCYVCSRRPDTDNKNAFSAIESAMVTYKPPLILAVGEVGMHFLPELRAKKDPEKYKGQLQKNAGSLLCSDSIAHDHYIIPVYSPDYCMADWQERNVTTYIDFQKVRDELQYYRQHGTLQPLPQRTLLYHDMQIDELIAAIDKLNSPIISDDIENPIYKTKDYLPHPGYPILLALADSPTYGISFKLFRDNPKENRMLWRRLDKLFREVRLLGQNIFNYDVLFHDMLGFSIKLDNVIDTLIRHHILWPELSHKLQFMTRQYTREPYYKDESQTYGIKAMDRYRRYNALDATITYEVYLRQEEEFALRSHLA